MADCAVCNSPLRGQIDQLLAVRPGGSRAREDFPLSDVADFIEAVRVRDCPQAAPITVEQLAFHDGKHQLAPRQPAPVLGNGNGNGHPENLAPTIQLTEHEQYVIPRIEDATDAIIAIGAHNLRLHKDKITPAVLLQAIRIKYEMERGTGVRDELRDIMEDFIKKGKIAVKENAG